MKQRICPGCEERFSPYHRNHKFCSRRCASRLEARSRLGIEDPGLVRQCWWCRSEFRLLDGRRDYCSTECARLGSLLGDKQRLYGITRDEYRDLYFRQGGLCAICKRPESTERNMLPAVDHDHVADHVRGLLCSQCNRAIGLLRDDSEVIQAAADYVRGHRELRLVQEGL